MARSGCVETSEPRAGYRPCVGIFLLDQADRVFVGRRADLRQEAWQLPQGGIDPGETPDQAGLREMFEEIGTNKARLLKKSRVWRSYDLPADLAARMWKGRYKGQTQLWIAYRFEGSEADIDLAGTHPEFAAHRWVDPEQLVALTVPFKRGVYGAVLDEFRELWAD
ncbi:putative (di)nucleoside polyphosphate hydrolase [Arboricoccus pini]|uniref:RNA pyrophosphohydrolase n=1 Tax=Arboricoccus pini TaxID=1963835 RepID=A0A212QYB7_9PROT|nr:RNA pyrophosphohydrolase [Arboricoccus pini]SNB64621.1 putative (di)nucleoside polyphosphate hydrolase [Arboricoccus pini]